MQTSLAVCSGGDGGFDMLRRQTHPRGLTSRGASRQLAYYTNQRLVLVGHLGVLLAKPIDLLKEATNKTLFVITIN